jgi:hypothetical protein
VPGWAPRGLSQAELSTAHTVRETQPAGFAAAVRNLLLAT